MEVIKNTELLRHLELLKFNESIFIDIDDDICNRLKLIDFQKVSYENLFMSYINKTNEAVDEFNLQNFLKLYTDINIKQNDIIKTELINLIGLDCYKYIIKNNINYLIMYDINIVKIFK